MGIFGGYDEWSENERTADIYGLHIDSMTMKQSKICCPTKGICHTAITGGIKDELLVFGFLKKMFNFPEFNNFEFPPTDIIKVILQFYNQEMVHWINWQRNATHYGIYVDELIASLE